LIQKPKANHKTQTTEGPTQLVFKKILSCAQP
jgi:hypothetical protein